MSDEARYRRSRDGTTVHRAECKRAKTAAPWVYADGFTADRIVAEMAQYPWLRPCGACSPDVPDVRNGGAS